MFFCLVMFGEMMLFDLLVLVCYWMMNLLLYGWVYMLDFVVGKWYF